MQGRGMGMNLPAQWKLNLLQGWPSTRGSKVE